MTTPEPTPAASDAADLSLTIAGVLVYQWEQYIKSHCSSVTTVGEVTDLFTPHVRRLIAPLFTERTSHAAELAKLREDLRICRDHDESVCLALESRSAQLAAAQAEVAAERNLHGQTRVVVEELNTICNDLRNAGQPQFVRSEAIRLLREDQADLRAALAEAKRDGELKQTAVDLFLEWDNSPVRKQSAAMLDNIRAAAVAARSAPGAQKEEAC